MIRREQEGGVVLVSAQAVIDPGLVPDARSPWGEQTELRAEFLVEAVLSRNPSLDEMRASWNEASARPAQVSSPDDPMFGGYVGPGSFGSNELETAYRVEVSQKLPWSGKLDLRRRNASASAHAAGHDYYDAKLQLIERTMSAYFDYFLADRALDVNAEAQQLLREFRDNAQVRYRTGQTPQQDVYQAEVELGTQQERRLTLERSKQVAAARLNTLMHLPTETPLPPPPERLALPERTAGVRELQERALVQRPDLKASTARLVAEHAALALTCKEFFPDLEVMAAYDAFWQRPEQDLRPQVGVRMNLPIRTERRYAAVAEARARVARRQAELTRQVDSVNLQVEEAYREVLESEKTLQLYESTILPAARENVKAAVTAYATGKIPFLSLIEAQRSLVERLDRHNEITADLFRRRATLERSVGGSLLPAPPQAPPEDLLAPPILPRLASEPLKPAEEPEPLSSVAAP